jgi:1,4-alpha-glucan branching enzyme
MNPRTDPPIGSLCFVLHTHLPWVAHHGRWPVGEEWLHQAWAQSYARIFSMLDRLADQGQRDVLSLGITPVLAAQLDDPYCLQAHHQWLGDWQMRAIGLAGMSDPDRRAAGLREYRMATAAVESFERDFRHGVSPALRRWVDAGVVEVLSGPLSHTFTPGLSDPWAGAVLAAGMADTRLRLGLDPTGIWTPECAYRPGLETVFAAHGVDHLMLEGPTLLAAGASTDSPWLLADTEVRVVGRDLPLAYRVWSPRRGYPGGRWYRDFHTFDHEWGVKIHRVTSQNTPPQDKAPYDPQRARVATHRDALDFVTTVRERLLDQRRNNPDRPGLAVVAYDTELFGHWWHEGPEWLEQVLTLLPEAGITPRSLASALDHHEPAGRVTPGPGSWGSGKDFRVWTDSNSQDLRDAQDAAVRRVQSLLHPHRRGQHPQRHGAYDQAVTSLLLGLASDWVFMVSKDSAAEYARARLNHHLSDVGAIADEIEADRADSRDASWRVIGAADRPWGHLDARSFMG